MYVYCSFVYFFLFFLPCTLLSCNSLLYLDCKYVFFSMAKAIKIFKGLFSLNARGIHVAFKRKSISHGLHHKKPTYFYKKPIAPPISKINGSFSGKAKCYSFTAPITAEAC